LLCTNCPAGAQGGGPNWRKKTSRREIVDLRSIKPLDEKTIFDSVAKTHRVVIVEQDHPFCGVGAGKFAIESRKTFSMRSTPPSSRVSQEDVPMPYNERLEESCASKCRQADRRRENKFATHNR